MVSPSRPRVVAGLRLLRQVGEGAEGEVWETRDRSGRRRALKLIRPNALVPPAEVELRGRWLLAIDHPALVTVHRCGVLSGAGLDGWGFVEMAFVDGPALDVAPADPDALERLAPLAEALDLLHAGAWSDGVPLVHRDVKPANLIESADGDLVLVDASTLRDVDDDTRTRIGTPLYAAPEVVTGRAGPLADVYGFAATAVALLTGARRGELALLLETPEDLDIPEGLRAALAADPADRPVSCRAALDPGLPLIVGHEVGWGPVDAGWAVDDQARDADFDAVDPSSRGGGAWPGSPYGGGPADAAGASPARHHEGVDGVPPDDGTYVGGPEAVPRYEQADAAHGSDMARDGRFDELAHPQVSRWPPPGASAPSDSPEAWGGVEQETRRPTATQVLLEPWRDPFEEQPPPVPPWGWIALLATLVAVPLGTALTGVPLQDGLSAVLVVAVAHLAVGVLARRPLREVVLAPPLAWASLLAIRAAAPGVVRGWARTALLACVSVLAVLSVGAALRPDLVEAVTAAVLSAAALAATAAAVHAASAGRLWRAALAPAWFLGAGVFVVVGMLLLLPAALVGRGGRVAGAMARTLGGAAAFVRRA